MTAQPATGDESRSPRAPWAARVYWIVWCLLAGAYLAWRTAAPPHPYTGYRIVMTALLWLMYLSLVLLGTVARPRGKPTPRIVTVESLIMVGLAAGLWH